MKTFRFSLVALVATVLFAACSNDEAVLPANNEAQAISFRTQGGTPEVTPRSTATTIDNIEAFVVYGTDYTPPPASPYPGTPFHLFTGETVARVAGASSNLFDYNPKKYYSTGATTASFFAYSPVSAGTGTPTLTAPIVTNLSAGVTFDYKVTPPDASGNTVQEDLLVAGITVTPPSPTPVYLGFTHALSRIFVKAKNSLAEDVVITGLELKNLYTTGTMTGTPAWTWTWAPTGSKTHIPFVLAPTGVAVPAGTGSPNAVLVTSMEQGMLVLPQVTANTTPDDHTNGDFALEVKYRVANLLNQTAYVYLTDGYPFEIGTQYAITIDFSGTDLIEIKFIIGVGTFTDDPATMP